MTEVAYVKESITPDNVYIIDNGLTIYQVSLLTFWNILDWYFHFLRDDL